MNYENHLIIAKRKNKEKKRGRESCIYNNKIKTSTSTIIDNPLNLVATSFKLEAILKFSFFVFLGAVPLICNHCESTYKKKLIKKICLQFIDSFILLPLEPIPPPRFQTFKLTYSIIYIISHSILYSILKI